MRPTEENIQLLADRIIKGGSGVYGDIPMTAHTDLSVEDAKKMARYILSLDEQK
jgi:cytochrome c